MAEHLFVYGTLRAESIHPMAHRLRVGAKHVGRGSAPGALYDLGEYPGAVFAVDSRYRVVGDLFQLGPNKRLLADLDKYEGVSGGEDDLFKRIQVEVALDKGGAVEAWSYGLIRTPRARLIGTGDFISDRHLRPLSPRP